MKNALRIWSLTVERAQLISSSRGLKVDNEAKIVALKQIGIYLFSLNVSFFVDCTLSGSIDIGISHSLYSQQKKAVFYEIIIYARKTLDILLFI
jgi:hypothetical protein